MCFRSTVICSNFPSTKRARGSDVASLTSIANMERIKINRRRLIARVRNVAREDNAPGPRKKSLRDLYAALPLTFPQTIIINSGLRCELRVGRSACTPFGSGTRRGNSPVQNPLARVLRDGIEVLPLWPDN
jgi:hypothetical protein